MLKFSVHMSSSESDLRSETSSQLSSSTTDGHHKCQECDKRRRTLSKERSRLNRNTSRSCERLNCNNNRCNHDDSSTNGSMATSPTMSDGQESSTGTATTSNSEMSSGSATSFYKRFQLRARSKSKGKKGADKTGRSSSPESRTTNSETESERRGRRGLWELQKEARLRVLGPDSRVGRWVGKLRSRSSEARLGTLKSRYSDIRNWEGWNLEPGKEPDGRANEYDTPTITVNDHPVLYHGYGKKMIRARSTEAISWGPKQDRSRDDVSRRSRDFTRGSRDFARESPVRKSFEKAMDNKRCLSPEAYTVLRPPRLHSGFESEPNLARRHIYDERRNNERLRRNNDADSSHPHIRSNKNSNTHGSDNRHHNRRPCTQTRQSCQSERVHSDSSWSDSDRQHSRSDSERRRIYQKNQRPGQNANMTLRNFNKKPPQCHQRSSHSCDSHTDIRSHGSRSSGKHEVRSHVGSEVPRHLQRHTDDSESCRYNLPKSRSTNDIEHSGSARNSSRNRHHRHHDRTLEVQLPVRGQYIPPRIPSNEAQVKKCTVAPKNYKELPTHNLSTKVSMSCTALHSINSETNLQRCQSEQQLKRSSVASVVSLESLDSGTSCSDGRRPRIDHSRTTKTFQKTDNQGNISVRSSDSSDSGYRSPISDALSKKDYVDVESIVLSSCFGEKVKVAKKKPAIHTSDYESETGYDDRGTRASNVSKNISKHRSTEKLQRIDDDDDDDDNIAPRHQRSPHRRSPRKSKHSGQNSRSSSSSKKPANIELEFSELTTKVSAKYSFKAMSTSEMSVKRGDTLYLNRAHHTKDVTWLRAFSSNTGEVGLIPTVILCPRMEDFV